MKPVHVALALVQLASVRLVHANTKGHQGGPRRLRQRGGYGNHSGRYLFDEDNVFVRSDDDDSDGASRRPKGSKKKARGKIAKSDDVALDLQTPAPTPIKADEECVAAQGKAGSKCEKGDTVETSLPPAASSSGAPTVSPVALPTIAPTTIAPTTMAPTFLPTTSPTKSPTAAPSSSPTTVPTLTPSTPTQMQVQLVATTTIVSIDVDYLDKPSFQDIIDAASLLCEQISLQSSVVIAQAAPLIVGRDVDCSILRDSNEDAILLEVDMTFEDSSIIMLGESEIAALICFAVTGRNAVPLLNQFAGLPPSNGFASASSIRCSLVADTNAPSARPVPPPTTPLLTVSPTTRLTGSPTDSPTREPTALPSRPPATKSPTRAPTKSPTREPTIPPVPRLTNAPSAQPVPSPTKFPTSVPVIRPVIATLSPASRPAIEQTRRPTAVPDLLPTISPRPTITKRPSLSPVAFNSPTAGPFLSTPLPTATAPPSGAIALVPATQFSIDYAVSSIIALETQDFVDTAMVTCEHVRAQMLRFFESGFTTVVDFLCTPVQTSEDPLFIEYDILVAFNGASAGTPTTADVDILVGTAFQQPNVADLLAALQAVGGVNPFSTTLSASYRKS